MCYSTKKRLSMIAYMSIKYITTICIYTSIHIFLHTDFHQTHPIKHFLTAVAVQTMVSFSIFFFVVINFAFCYCIQVNSFSSSFIDSNSRCIAKHTRMYTHTCVHIYGQLIIVYWYNRLPGRTLNRIMHLLPILIFKYFRINFKQVAIHDDGGVAMGFVVFFFFEIYG